MRQSDTRVVIKGHNSPCLLDNFSKIFIKTITPISIQAVKLSLLVCLWLQLACPTTTTTTTRGKGLTWRVEGGCAAPVSFPLPRLSLPHLWNQVRSRGWTLLQGGEFTGGGTCPCPLPLMWQPSLSLRRVILLFQSPFFLCLDVKIQSTA